MPTKKNTKPAKTMLPLNADNWTKIKGKEVDKQLRSIMPSKREIFDSKGRLKIDQDTYDKLTTAIDWYRSKNKTPVRDAKTGRFTKKESEDLSMDKTLAAMREENLSPNEKAMAATLQVLRLGADPGMAKSMQTTLKNTGVIRNKAWYEAKYWLESGSFDADKMTQEQAEDIVEAVYAGHMDSSNITEDEWNEILNTATGRVESEEAREELNKRGATVGGTEVKGTIVGGVSPAQSAPGMGRQMRGRELKGMIDALGRMLGI